MKIKIIIQIFIFLISISSAKSMNECLEGFQRLQERGLAVEVSGKDVWGTYFCSGSECGVETSAKPINEFGKRQCEGCGRHHTDEKFLPPAIFDKYDAKTGTTKRFLLKTSALVTSDHAHWSGKGALEECPFCGNSHFKNQSECLGCGVDFVSQGSFEKAFSEEPAVPAFSSSTMFTRDVRAIKGEVEAAQVKQEREVEANIRKIIDQGPEASKGSTTKVKSVLDGMPGASQLMGTSRDPEILKKFRDTPEIEESGQLHFSSSQKVLFSATGGLFLATLGTATYMQATKKYQVDAKVVGIESQKVWVEYTRNNKKVRLPIEYHSGESTHWYMGEIITLYFIHWKGAQGGERGNSEVFDLR